MCACACVFMSAFVGVCANQMCVCVQVCGYVRARGCARVPACACTCIICVNACYASSVGPYVISCQMFVKSEFPLDSALVCDSDQKKLGWHFFRKL